MFRNRFGVLDTGHPSARKRSRVSGPKSAKVWWAKSRASTPNLCDGTGRARSVAGARWSKMGLEPTFRNRFGVLEIGHPCARKRSRGSGSKTAKVWWAKSRTSTPNLCYGTGRARSVAGARWAKMGLGPTFRNRFGVLDTGHPCSRKRSRVSDPKTAKVWWAKSRASTPNLCDGTGRARYVAGARWAKLGLVPTFRNRFGVLETGDPCARKRSRVSGPKTAKVWWANSRASTPNLCDETGRARSVAGARWGAKLGLHRFTSPQAVVLLTTQHAESGGCLRFRSVQLCEFQCPSVDLFLKVFDVGFT